MNKENIKLPKNTQILNQEQILKIYGGRVEVPQKLVMANCKTICKPK